MQAAKDKYGKEVYNKMYLDLQQEFGTEAFPSSMTRFRGEDTILLGPKNVELWYITECFCYRSYPKSHFTLDNPYFQGRITETELEHIKQFASVFMYDDVCELNNE